ncbi:MAG: DUF4296 domain-containing protein [Phocaeicola sp.]
MKFVSLAGRKTVQAILGGLLLFTSCSDTTKKPVGFIEPAQMEEVLYDYHLGLSMSSNLPYAENYKKESYLNYLYEKHGITAAQFDSSMVWYTRHTKEMTTMYDNLTNRFKGKRTYLQELIALRDNAFKGSLEGDTVDIWQGSSLHWLSDYPLTNKVAFEMKADSNFRPKDRFLWEADFLFLQPDSQRVVVGLSILLDNDSVIGKTETFTASTHMAVLLQADTDSVYTIKQVNGFIYYTDSATHNLGVFVNNIHLMRYHDLSDTVAVVSQELMPEVELTQGQKDSLEEVKRQAADRAFPTEVLAPAPNSIQLMEQDKRATR